MNETHFKPLLRAIALVVVEAFLFTQIAWADAFGQRDWRRLINSRFRSHRPDPISQVLQMEKQKQEILDRRNMAVETGQLARTVEALSPAVSEATLRQIESRSMTDAVKPSLLAPSMGQFLEEGGEARPSDHFSLPGSKAAVELFDSPRPDAAAATSAHLETILESGSERVAKDRLHLLSEKEEVYSEFDSLDIETTMNRFGSLISSAYEDGFQFGLVGKSFDEEFLGIFHAYGRHSMKALLAEIRAFEAGLDAEGEERQEKEEVAKGVVAGKRGERNIFPSGKVGPLETFGSEGGRDHRPPLPGPDPFPGEDPLPGERPPGPPETYPGGGHGYQDRGVIRDPNGNLISEYLVTVSYELAIINNRLRIVGSTRTYQYTNADGTTGIETISWRYLFDDKGRINGKETTTFKDGWVPDRKAGTAPRYYDHVTTKEMSRVTRDDQDRVIRYETIYISGNQEIHYVLEVDKYNETDPNVKEKWSETTTIRNLQTNEKITITTRGEATTFGSDGRPTGFHISTSVKGEGIDPERMAQILPQVQEQAQALSRAFNAFVNFLNNHRDKGFLDLIRPQNVHDPRNVTAALEFRILIENVIAAYEAFGEALEGLGFDVTALNFLFEGTKSTVDFLKLFVDLFYGDGGSGGTTPSEYDAYLLEKFGTKDLSQIIGKLYQEGKIDRSLYNRLRQVKTFQELREKLADLSPREVLVLLNVGLVTYNHLPTETAQNFILYLASLGPRGFQRMLDRGEFSLDKLPTFYQNLWQKFGTLDLKDAIRSLQNRMSRDTYNKIRNARTYEELLSILPTLSMDQLNELVDSGTFGPSRYQGGAGLLRLQDLPGDILASFLEYKERNSPGAMQYYLDTGRLDLHALPSETLVKYLVSIGNEGIQRLIDTGKLDIQKLPAFYRNLWEKFHTLDLAKVIRDLFADNPIYSKLRDVKNFADLLQVLPTLTEDELKLLVTKELLSRDVLLGLLQEGALDQATLMRFFNSGVGEIHAAFLSAVSSYVFRRFGVNFSESNFNRYQWKQFINSLPISDSLKNLLLGQSSGGVYNFRDAVRLLMEAFRNPEYRQELLNSGLFTLSLLNTYIMGDLLPSTVGLSNLIDWGVIKIADLRQMVLDGTINRDFLMSQILSGKLTDKHLKTLMGGYDIRTKEGLSEIYAAFNDFKDIYGENFVNFLSGVNDYSIETDISNIVYDTAGQWASFYQEVRTIGRIKLSNGKMVDINQLVVIDQRATAFDADGRLKDAVLTITTTDYTKAPTDKDYQKTETITRSNMTYIQGLMIGETLHKWVEVREGLARVFGITADTFSNGFLDAQAWIDRVNLGIDLNQLIGNLPSGVTVDQVDRIVFELISAFLFAAITRGTYNSSVIQSAISAIPGANEIHRNLATTLANAIFGKLEEAKTEGTILQGRVVFLLRQAGLKGDLSKVEARYLIAGYQEEIRKRDGTGELPKVEHHDYVFEYDNKGRLLKMTDRVHEVADEQFRNTDLLDDYLTMIRALYPGRPIMDWRDVRAIRDKFNEFKQAIINKFGSLEAAPAQIREFVTKLEAALYAGNLRQVVNAIKGFKDWARDFNLPDQVVRTHDLRYTVIQDNMKYDDRGRLINYQETWIGMDPNSGNPTPGVTTYVDVTIAYDAIGQVSSKTFEYRYEGGVPENAIRRRVLNDFLYDGFGSAIGWTETRTYLSGRTEVKYTSDVIINHVTGQIISLKEKIIGYDRDGRNPRTLDFRYQYNMRYDIHGRLVSYQGFHNGRYVYSQMSYNALGQLSRVVNQDGVTFRMKYNTLGQLVGYHYRPWTGDTKLVIVKNIRYDEAGRIISQDSISYIDSKKVKGTQWAHHTFTYDQFGRVISERIDSYFKGKAKKNVKVWDDTTYFFKYDDYGNKLEAGNVNHYRKEEVQKGLFDWIGKVIFWQLKLLLKVYRFLFKNIVAKLLDTLGLKKLANSVRNIANRAYDAVTKFLEKWGALIAIIMLSIVTYGVLAPALLGALGFAASGFMLTLATGVIMATLTFVNALTQGQDLKSALKDYAKGLALAVITAGITAGLQDVFRQIGEVLAKGLNALGNAIGSIHAIFKEIIEFVKGVFNAVKNAVIWAGSSISFMGAKMVNAITEAIRGLIMEKALKELGMGGAILLGAFLFGSITHMMNTLLIPRVQAALKKAGERNGVDPLYAYVVGTVTRVAEYFRNAVEGLRKQLGDATASFAKLFDIVRKDVALYVKFFFNEIADIWMSEFLTRSFTKLPKVLVRDGQPAAEPKEEDRKKSEWYFIVGALLRAFVIDPFVEFFTNVTMAVGSSIGGIIPGGKKAEVERHFAGPAGAPPGLGQKLADSVKGLWNNLRFGLPFNAGRTPNVKEFRLPNGGRVKVEMRFGFLQKRTFTDAQGRVVRVENYTKLGQLKDVEVSTYQEYGLNETFVFDGTKRPTQVVVAGVGVLTFEEWRKTHLAAGLQKTEFFLDKNLIFYGNVGLFIDFDQRVVSIFDLKTDTEILTTQLTHAIGEIGTYGQAITFRSPDGRLVTSIGIATKDVQTVAYRKDDWFEKTSYKGKDAEGKDVAKEFSLETLLAALPKQFREAVLKGGRINVIGSQLHVYADDKKIQKLFIFDVATETTLYEEKSEKDFGLYLYQGGATYSINALLPNELKHLLPTIQDGTLGTSALLQGHSLALADAENRTLLTLNFEKGEVSRQIYPQGAVNAAENELVREWNGKHPDQTIHPDAISDPKQAEALVNLLKNEVEILKSLTDPVEREKQLKRIEPLVTIVLERMTQLEEVLKDNKQYKTTLNDLTGALVGYLEIAESVSSGKLGNFLEEMKGIRDGLPADNRSPPQETYRNQLGTLIKRLENAIPLLKEKITSALQQGRFEEAVKHLKAGGILSQVSTLEYQVARTFYEMGGIQGMRLEAIRKLKQHYDERMGALEKGKKSPQNDAEIDRFREAVKVINTVLADGKFTEEQIKAILEPIRTPRGDARNILSEYLPRLLMTEASGIDTSQTKEKIREIAKAIGPEFEKGIDKILLLLESATSENMYTLSQAVKEFNSTVLRQLGYRLYIQHTPDGSRMTSKLLDIIEAETYEYNVNGKRGEIQKLDVSYPAASGEALGSMADLEARLEHLGYTDNDVSVVFLNHLKQFVSVINDPTFRGIVDLSALSDGQGGLSSFGRQVAEDVVGDHEVGHGMGNKVYLVNKDPKNPGMESVKDELLAYFFELLGANFKESLFLALIDQFYLATSGKDISHAKAASILLRGLYERYTKTSLGEAPFKADYMGSLLKFAKEKPEEFRKLVADFFKETFGAEAVVPHLVSTTPVASSDSLDALYTALTVEPRLSDAYNTLTGFADELVEAIKTRKFDLIDRKLAVASGMMQSVRGIFSEVEDLLRVLGGVSGLTFFGTPEAMKIQDAGQAEAIRRLEGTLRQDIDTPLAGPSSTTVMVADGPRSALTPVAQTHEVVEQRPDQTFKTPQTKKVNLDGKEPKEIKYNLIREVEILDTRSGIRTKMTFYYMDKTLIYREATLIDDRTGRAIMNEVYEGEMEFRGEHLYLKNVTRVRMYLDESGGTRLLIKEISTLVDDKVRKTTQFKTKLGNLTAEQLAALKERGPQAIEQALGKPDRRVDIDAQSKTIRLYQGDTLYDLDEGALVLDQPFVDIKKGTIPAGTKARIEGINGGAVKWGGIIYASGAEFIFREETIKVKGKDQKVIVPAFERGTLKKGSELPYSGIKNGSLILDEDVFISGGGLDAIPEGKKARLVGDLVKGKRLTPEWNGVKYQSGALLIFKKIFDEKDGEKIFKGISPVFESGTVMAGSILPFVIEGGVGYLILMDDAPVAAGGFDAMPVGTRARLMPTDKKQQTIKWNGIIYAAGAIFKFREISEMKEGKKVFEKIEGTNITKTGLAFDSGTLKARSILPYDLKGGVLILEGDVTIEGGGLEAIGKFANGATARLEATEDNPDGKPVQIGKLLYKIGAVFGFDKAGHLVPLNGKETLVAQPNKLAELAGRRTRLQADIRMLEAFLGDRQTAPTTRKSLRESIKTMKLELADVEEQLTNMLPDIEKGVKARLGELGLSQAALSGLKITINDIMPDGAVRLPTTIRERQSIKDEDGLVRSQELILHKGSLLEFNPYTGGFSILYGIMEVKDIRREKSVLLLVKDQNVPSEQETTHEGLHGSLKGVPGHGKTEYTASAIPGTDDVLISGKYLIRNDHEEFIAPYAIITVKGNEKVQILDQDKEFAPGEYAHIRPEFRIKDNGETEMELVVENITTRVEGARKFIAEKAVAAQEEARADANAFLPEGVTLDEAWNPVTYTSVRFGYHVQSMLGQFGRFFGRFMHAVGLRHELFGFIPPGAKVAEYFKTQWVDIPSQKAQILSEIAVSESMLGRINILDQIFDSAIDMGLSILSFMTSIPNLFYDIVGEALRWDATTLKAFVKSLFEMAEHIIRNIRIAPWVGWTQVATFALPGLKGGLGLGGGLAKAGFARAIKRLDLPEGVRPTMRQRIDALGEGIREGFEPGAAKGFKELVMFPVNMVLIPFKMMLAINLRLTLWSLSKLGAGRLVVEAMKRYPSLSTGVSRLGQWIVDFRRGRPTGEEPAQINARIENYEGLKEFATNKAAKDFLTKQLKRLYFQVLEALELQQPEAVRPTFLQNLKIGEVVSGVKVTEALKNAANELLTHRANKYVLGLTPGQLQEILDTRLEDTKKETTLADGRTRVDIFIQQAALRRESGITGNDAIVVNRLLRLIAGEGNNPAELSKRIEAIEKALKDPENQKGGRNVIDVIADALKDLLSDTEKQQLRQELGKLGEYTLTKSSAKRLLNFLVVGVNTLNAYLAIPGAGGVKGLWGFGKPGIQFGREMEFMRFSTPEAVEAAFKDAIAFEQKLATEVAQFAKEKTGKELGEKGGWDFKKALKEYLKERIELRKGEADALMEVLKPIFKAIDRGEEVTSPVKPSPDASISEFVKYYFVKLKLEAKAHGIDFNLGGKRTQVQIAFTLEIANLLYNRHTGVSQLPVVLQAIQGGGKSLGYLLGARIAIDKLQNQDPSKGPIDILFVTSKESLIRQILREKGEKPTALEHLAMDELKRDVEIDSTLEKTTEALAQRGKATTPRITFVDNYSFKRLGLDLTGLYQDKENIQNELDKIKTQVERGDRSSVDAQKKLEQELAAVQKKIDNHMVKQVTDLLFDEIQAALVDGDIIEGPGREILTILSAEKIEKAKFAIKSRLRLFTRIYDEYRGNPDVIRRATENDVAVRERHKLDDTFRKRLWEEHRSQPDALGRAEFDAFVDAVANALRMEQGKDYYIDETGSINYSVARFGVNQPETIFGNPEIGTAVLMKTYVQRFRLSSEGRILSEKEIVAKIEETEGAFDGMLISHLHRESRRSSTLETLALVGLDKVTFGTGTATAHRGTFARFGVGILAFSPESPIAYGWEKFVMTIARRGRDAATEAAIEQVVRAFQEAGVRPVKIVITGASTEWLKLVATRLRELQSRGELPSNTIISFLEGRDPTRMDWGTGVIGRRYFQGHESKKHHNILLLPDFGEGSNLFKLARWMGGQGENIQAVVMELGMRGETHRQQLAARLYGTLRDPDAGAGRAPGQFISIIDIVGTEILEAEGAALGQGGVGRAVAGKVSRIGKTIDSEQNVQNQRAVVYKALSKSDREQMQLKMFNEQIMDWVKRAAEERDFALFQKLRDILDLREALLKGAPATQSKAERDAYTRAVDAFLKTLQSPTLQFFDKKGKVTEIGQEFLKFLDALTAFDTVSELKADAERLGLKSLSFSALEGKVLANAEMKNHLFGAAQIALARFTASLKGQETFQKALAPDLELAERRKLLAEAAKGVTERDLYSLIGVRRMMRDILNKSLVEFLPEVSYLTDQEFEMVAQAMRTTTDEVQNSIAVAKAFAKIYLTRLDEAHRKTETNDRGEEVSVYQYDKEKTQRELYERRKAVTAFIRFLEREPVTAPEEILFRAKIIAHRHQGVSSLELLNVAMPLMGEQQRLSAGYAMDRRFGEVKGIYEADDVRLPESLRQYLAKSGYKGKVTVMENGLTKTYYQHLNHAFMFEEPDPYGGGMIVRFGHDPRHYRLVDGKPVLTGKVETVTAESADLSPEGKAALVEALQEKRLDLHTPLLAVTQGQGNGTYQETYYVDPTSQEILHAKVTMPLYADEYVRALNILFPGEVSREDSLVIETTYTKGLPTKSLILNGSRLIGTSDVQVMHAGDVEDATVRAVFAAQAVGANRLVVVRTFKDKYGKEIVLKDRHGKKIQGLKGNFSKFTTVLGATQAMQPTGMHLLVRGIFAEIGLKEQKPDVTVVELDFQQKDALESRNDSPTAEVQRVGAQLSFNIHPDYLNKLTSAVGFDPVIGHRVGGVEQTLHLNASLLYRNALHELRGHGRILDPYFASSYRNRFGPSLTPAEIRDGLAKGLFRLIHPPSRQGFDILVDAKTGKEIARVDQNMNIRVALTRAAIASGIERAVFHLRALSSRPGLHALIDSKTGKEIARVDEEMNIHSVTEKYFEPVTEYTIQTNERIAETLSGGNYRAVLSAARFVYWFIPQIQEHDPEKVIQNIDDFIFRYGVKDSPDYEFLVKDPVLKEEVKQIAVKFVQAIFEARKRQEAARLAPSDLQGAVPPRPSPVVAVPPTPKIPKIDRTPEPVSFTAKGGAGYRLETLTAKQLVKLLPQLVAIEAANRSEGHSRVWAEKDFVDFFKRLRMRGADLLSQVILNPQGKAAGFILNYVDDEGRVYTEWLTVHPDYQGQRLAQGLLGASAKAAKRLGLKEIALHVLEGNTAAMRAYEKAGYKQGKLEKLDDGKPRYLYQADVDTVIARTLEAPKQPAVPKQEPGAQGAPKAQTETSDSASRDGAGRMMQERMIPKVQEPFIPMTPKATPLPPYRIEPVAKDGGALMTETLSGPEDGQIGPLFHLFDELMQRGDLGGAKNVLLAIRDQASHLAPSQLTKLQNAILRYNAALAGLVAPERPVTPKEQFEIGNVIGPYGHRINGGVSRGRRGINEREIILVDRPRDVAFNKFIQEIIDLSGIRGLAGQLGADERGLLVKRVYDAVVKQIQYDEDYVEKLARQYAGKEVLIGDAAIKPGCGVCRHHGITVAALLEYLIEKEYLKGKVYYVRGPYHGWAVYRTSGGKFFVLDVAQRYFGPMKGATYGDRQGKRYAYENYLPQEVQEEPVMVEGIPTFIPGADGKSGRPDRIIPAVEHKVEKLGGDRKGGRLETPFVGEIWISAGNFAYRVWVEGPVMKFQRYDKVRGKAMGSIHEASLGQQFTVGRESGDYRYPDETLSAIHFVLKVTQMGKNQFLLTVADLRSLHGMAIEWRMPQTARDGALRQAQGSVPSKQSASRDGAAVLEAPTVTTATTTRMQAMTSVARDGGNATRLADFGDVSVEIARDTVGIEYLVASIGELVKRFAKPEAEDAFAEELILLFGERTKPGTYRITQMVRIPDSEYEARSHDHVIPNEAYVAKMIERFAIGDTQLLGTFHTHPPRRQLSNKVGPSSEDNPRNVIPKGINSYKVVPAPIGIVGELALKGLSWQTFRQLEKNPDEAQLRELTTLYTYRFNSEGLTEVAEPVRFTQIEKMQKDFAKDGGAAVVEEWVPSETLNLRDLPTVKPLTPFTLGIPLSRIPEETQSKGGQKQYAALVHHPALNKLPLKQLQGIDTRALSNGRKDVFEDAIAEVIVRNGFMPDGSRPKPQAQRIEAAPKRSVSFSTEETRIMTEFLLEDLVKKTPETLSVPKEPLEHLLYQLDGDTVDLLTRNLFVPDFEGRTLLERLGASIQNSPTRRLTAEELVKLAILFSRYRERVEAGEGKRAAFKIPLVSQEKMEHLKDLLKGFDLHTITSQDVVRFIAQFNSLAISVKESVLGL